MFGCFGKSIITASPNANPPDKHAIPANNIAGGDKSDATLVKNPESTPNDMGIAKIPDEIRAIDARIAA
jgi:hypothetical protein